jgi:hypothetical protein
MVSGTPMFHGTVDLMYLLNLAYGPAEDKSLVLPLTEAGFRKQFYKIPKSIALLRGWLLPLLALQFWGVGFTTRILDVLDFYRSMEPSVKADKTTFIKRIMPYIFLDPKMAGIPVLRASKDGGPRTFHQYVSAMLFWFMYSPFNNLLPIFFSIALVKSNDELYKPRMDRLQAAVAPAMRREELRTKVDLRGAWHTGSKVGKSIFSAAVGTGVGARAGFRGASTPGSDVDTAVATKVGAGVGAALGGLSASKVKVPPVPQYMYQLPKATGVYATRGLKNYEKVVRAPLRQVRIPNTDDMEYVFPMTEIIGIPVAYNYSQLQMFMRMSVNRLVATDYRKLGIAGVDNDDDLGRAVSFELKNGNLDLKQFMRYGLIIGNTIFSEKDLADVKTERRQSSAPRMDAIRRLVDGPEGSGKAQEPQAPAESVTPTAESQAEDTATADSIQSEPVGTNPKFDVLLRIIKDRKDDKHVVYSQFWTNGLLAFAAYARDRGVSKMRALVDAQSYLQILTGNERVVVDKLNDESQSADDVKEWYNKTLGAILLLDPRLTEGVDGMLYTSALHVLEPLESPSNLAQLRARVARTRSHKKPVDGTVGTTVQMWQNTINPKYGRPSVKIFEYRMSMKWWMKTSGKVGEWIKSEPSIVFISRTTDHNQDVTPDMLVYREQKRGSKVQQQIRRQVAESQEKYIDIKERKCVWFPNTHMDWDDECKSDSDVNCTNELDPDRCIEVRKTVNTENYKLRREARTGVQRAQEFVRWRSPETPPEYPGPEAPQAV